VPQDWDITQTGFTSKEKKEKKEDRKGAKGEKRGEERRKGEKEREMGRETRSLPIEISCYATVANNCLKCT